MMARGKSTRKFPEKAKKARQERQREMVANDNWQDKFEYLTGRKRRNNKDNAIATLLHLLKERGQIDEFELQAGLLYSYLYWHRARISFGKNGGSGFYDDLVANGSIGFPRAVVDASSEEKEVMFIELDDKIKQAGHKARHEVQEIAFFEIIPAWFERYIEFKNGNKVFIFKQHEIEQKEYMKSGLRALV